MIDLAALSILLEGARQYDDGSGVVPLRYGEAGAVEIETGIFLYGLVRRLQPQVIVETGTSRGWSAACMAVALRDNGRGHAWTLDINEYDGEKYALWERLNLGEWVHAVRKDSLVWAPPGSIDLLFLDSDHTADFVEREFRHYAPFLATAACVLVHDTFLPTAGGVLHDCVQRIAIQARRQFASVAHVAFSNWRGLDMLQLTRIT